MGLSMAMMMMMMMMMMRGARMRQQLLPDERDQPRSSRWSLSACRSMWALRENRHAAQQPSNYSPLLGWSSPRLKGVLFSAHDESSPTVSVSFRKSSFGGAPHD